MNLHKRALWTALDGELGDNIHLLGLVINLQNPENIVLHPSNSPLIHPSVVTYRLQAPGAPTAASLVTWAPSCDLCSLLSTTLTPSTKTESTPSPT